MIDSERRPTPADVNSLKPCHQCTAPLPPARVPRACVGTRSRAYLLPLVVACLWLTAAGYDRDWLLSAELQRRCRGTSAVQLDVKLDTLAKNQVEALSLLRQIA
jgi:hypothetical protein